MIKIQFESGMLKIQEVFNSEYSKPMKDAIFYFVQKWRESTWNRVVEFLIYSFKPGYNQSLPVPADFKKTYGDIPLDDEYIPISRQNNGEYASPEEIAAIFEPLVKKIQGGKTFRLRSSHINGQFACEICFRNGCNGVTFERMKNGCGGFLTEERAKEIEEIKRLEKQTV